LNIMGKAIILVISAILYAVSGTSNSSAIQMREIPILHRTDGNDNTYVLCLQKCNAQSPWTIHGLWPQWAMDCPGKKFDVGLLSSIRSQLNQNWLSCPGMGSTNEAFWEHEWSKHGTCTTYAQLQYFQTVLSVYNRAKTDCKLGSNEDCRLCIDKNLQLC